MKVHRSRLLAMLSLLSWFWAAALGAAELPSSPPAPDDTTVRRISSIGQIWSVSDEVRDQPHWLSTEITIAYWDPEWNCGWVVNGDVTPFLEPGRNAPDLKTGQRLRLEGWIMPHQNPALHQFQATPLEEKAEMPLVAMDGDLHDWRRWEGKLVTVEGLVVHQTDTDPTHLSLGLSIGGRSALAQLRMGPNDPQPFLTGAFIRFSAVYLNQKDVNGSVTEVALWILDPGVEVTGWLGSDPRFDRPPIAIEELPRHAGELVRVTGTVRSHFPGESLVVRDGTGQLRLNSYQRQPLKPDEAVELIGYAEATDAGWTLRAPLYRPLDTVNRPMPSQLVQRLRVAEQVMELVPEEAEQGLPVQLTGVVTWAHPEANFFFIRDTSGAVQVECAPALGSRPDVGATITLHGRTAAGPFAPRVVADRYGASMAFRVPEPYPSTLDQALTGADEAHRIELRGFVRSIEANGDWTDLLMTTAAGEFSVRLPANVVLEEMAGATVRVRGVCTALTNDRRQLIGIRLWAVDQRDFVVEEAVPADVFQIATRSAASLRRFNAQAFNRRVKVVGVVVHQAPGRYLVLQDGNDGLFVLTRQDEPLQPGDRVEVVGLPGRESRRMILREGVYRKTAEGSQPELHKLERVDEPVPDLDNTLVGLDAVLLEKIWKNGELRMVLQHEDDLVDAVLENVSTPPAWSVGSALYVQGVYNLVFDEYHVARSFRLQLRTPADVTVVRAASWWTAGRALTVATLLALAFLLALGFLALLRRRVNQQTQQIREQLAREASMEARYRDIVDNATDFIFVTDRQGRLTSFNPAGERITGYSAAEAIGRPLIAFLHPDDASRVLAALKARLRDNGIVSFQGRVRTKRGEEIWVETSARLLREGRSVVGVLGVARDISERKRFEEDLRHARDAAEASARAKSAFLANMSHEIRTPMNGVIGMSNLLLDTPLAADQRDFAETIRNSAEALLSVLNDILDFSKIEAGKLHFEDVAFDLGEVVENTLELMAARAFAKGLEVASFLPVEVPRHVRGDPGRIRQVLLNLVGNAIKFTETGEVVVAAQCETATGNRVRLRFEIKDTGIGLSAAQRHELFQPFMQADNSTTRRYGGTGLGLAICRQIVELMGGTIGVESQPGRGSVFWFTLTLERAEADPGAASIPDPAALVGRRVLVVDDNATNRCILRHYVSAWRMQPLLVGTAREGLDLLRQERAGGEPIDLVLLDYQMPEMDGAMFAEAVSAEGGAPTMVMLTSIDRRFSRSEMQRMGLSEILNKPVRQNELLRTLLRVVARETPVRRLSPPPARVSRMPTNGAARTALGLHVLVAEDNPVNVRVTLMQLGKLGCRAEVVGTGRAALAALERQSFDLILMDCQMPEMDGYEATRQLRQRPEFAGIRVVALTANAMEGDRERCLEAGMDDYVSKPVRLAELQAALERSLRALPAAANAGARN